MRTLPLFFFVFVFGSVAAAFVSYREDTSDVHDMADAISSRSSIKQTHPIFDFNRASFLDDIEAAGSAGPFSTQKNIRGGIIPHHTLPGFLIARFFRTLAMQSPSPERIILIGPNHPDHGNHHVLTSALDWRTLFGVVQSDRRAADFLMKEKIAAEDPAYISTEHSVAAIMPYLKYYLPNAKVLPLVMQSQVDSTEVQSIATKMSAYADDKTVVIAAVDFSHYLTATEAAQRDKYSRSCIEALSGNDFFGLGNDYLDSPPSIALLMRLMADVGATEAEIFANTNSGFLKNDFTQGVTSYFVVGIH